MLDGRVTGAGLTGNQQTSAVGVELCMLDKSNCGGDGPSASNRERPSSWLWYPVVGLVGGIAGAGVWNFFGHVAAPQSWTTVGLIATLTGVLAGLLGVMIAFVVAFQWLVFDRRVDERIQKHRRELEVGLRAYTLKRVQAIGELAIAWTQPIDERERVAQRILQLAPDTPNLAPLMAWMYLQQIAPVITKEMDKADCNLMVENASHWATVALQTRKYHDLGFPEWVMALVCARQKQPHRVLEYLPMAKAGGFIKQEGLPPDTWTILVGCTDGDEEAVDSVLHGLGVARPDRQQVQAHCEAWDSWHRAAFWAVERQTGSVRKIVLEKKSKADGDADGYSVVGHVKQLPHCLTLREMLDNIYQFYIPIVTIPGEFRTYVVPQA